MELTLKTHNIVGAGTFGLLSIKDAVIAHTCEREWLNNAPRISCVPAGKYDLIPHTSPKFGRCYVLKAPDLDVTVYGPSRRSHILIHAANWPRELEGCIALGKGWHPNGWGVRDSRTALNDFHDLMGIESGQCHTLIIERSL